MKWVVGALLIATSLPAIDLYAGQHQPLQQTAAEALALAPKPISLARLKYNGGGDWYSSRTALSNLAKFANQQLLTQFSLTESVVEVGSADIYRYPFIFMTGHGNVVFSETDAANLRTYLISGGFLHICDNFGMDPFIKREMKKVFPELSFQVVPFSHPIYKGAFQFPNGLPKVHEHEGKAPIGYGLFWEGKLICFYDYECDLGNGWEDPEVYKDPEAVRQQALRMGANLIQYEFTKK
ncbi:MAG: DUF4159 domain-containing protein [Bacteroidota bacterium]